MFHHLGYSKNLCLLTYLPPENDPAIHCHRQNAQKTGEVQSHGFRVMRADRQTDRQTNK